MNRREVIQRIAIGGATIFLMPSVVTSCQKNPDNNGSSPPPSGSTIKLDLNTATYSALKNPGGSVVVQSIIVANTGSGYVALDSVCTHNGCTIGYNLAANNFPCPCHGSIFSSTGSVLNGPASTPLKAYSVSLANDVLTVTI